MTATRLGAGLLLAACLARAQFGWWHARKPESSSKPASSSKKEAAGGILGVVVKTEPHWFVVHALDSRLVRFKLADSTLLFRGTRWARRSQLKRGAVVRVQADADDDGNLTATDIEFESAAPVWKPAAQARDLLPGGVATDPLIEKARHASDEFFRVLPDFVCQQSTTRFYAGADHHWRTVDNVTAEVLYDRGHESYREVKLNGRMTGGSIMDLKGSRSTGEFGSSLRALFDPDTAALFKYDSDAELGDFSTAIYDFAVSGDESDWRITAGSQTILTAYTGRIWIDRVSGNVVRIEMKAVDIPPAFPFRRIEGEVDYGPVTLPAGRYFLPARAENISCNDPNSCSRNVIEFRNYHKYVGESSITFGDPRP